MIVALGIVWSWCGRRMAGHLLAVTVAHFVINYFNLHYILRPCAIAAT